jgi:hypothetical protein
MQLFLLIIVMFVLSVFGIVQAIAQPSMSRRALFILGVLSPFIVILSAGRALFSSGEVAPCPVHLEAVERAVDAKRIAVFGGKRRTRYIADSWKQRYHKYLAKSTKYLVHHIEPSLA